MCVLTFFQITKILLIYSFIKRINFYLKKKSFYLYIFSNFMLYLSLIIMLSIMLNSFLKIFYTRSELIVRIVRGDIAHQEKQIVEQETRVVIHVLIQSKLQIVSDQFETIFQDITKQQSSFFFSAKIQKTTTQLSVNYERKCWDVGQQVKKTPHALCQSVVNQFVNFLLH